MWCAVDIATTELPTAERFGDFGMSSAPIFGMAIFTVGFSLPPARLTLVFTLSVCGAGPNPVAPGIQLQHAEQEKENEALEHAGATHHIQCCLTRIHR